MNAPIVRQSARIVDRDAATLLIQLDAREIEVGGATADLFRKMLPHLDGARSISAIAAAMGEPPARVDRLVHRLQELGVLRDSQERGAALGPMTGREFYDLHRKWAERWLRPVYEHPFWDKVMKGTAARAQVLGFAFEKYHYIEAAHEHMAIAAANATPEMMPHLARHFIEEYTHGDIYRRGLRSLFADEVILRSQPLPSTRALVNFLNESAARNSFGYYAGNELLQMTENSDAGADGAVDTFYAAMRKHYPATHRIVEAFIAHTRADQKLGHKNVFLEMCEAVPPLTAEQATDALNTTRSMAEHLLLFMDGVDRHYERFPAGPRLPHSLSAN